MNYSQSNKHYLLYQAIIDKNEDKIIQILKQYSELIYYVFHYDNTLLHFAVQKKFIKLMLYLLENNIKINYRNEFKFAPIHIAINKNSYEMVDILLQYKPYINLKGGLLNNSPLALAIKKNNNKIINLLFEQDFDINIININKYSLLHIACELGNEYVDRVARVIRTNELSQYDGYHLEGDESEDTDNSM